MPNPNQLIAFNGVNAANGQYGLQLNERQLADLIFGNASSAELRTQKDKYTDAVRNANLPTSRGVREGIDATNLAQAGWGVIFAYADPRGEAIREALQPLLALRQQQAGAHFRIFTGVNAYRPNESKLDFLRRFDVGSGAVDPSRGVPYYLLLIGGPALIPYEFQYQLDVQFAVGRLDFDGLEQYASYAASVAAAEQGQTQLARTASFFSVTNADDDATALTDQYLVQPLLDYLNPQFPDWQIQPFQKAAATRGQLESLLGGAQKPALLFTASHGIEFPLGDPKQERCQGALLCNEWPGPERWDGGALPEDFYFAGDHLASSANPSGMISFHFACYGGGTPQYYDFAHKETQERFPIAERPFVAHLPKQILGHPRGGALAVVSHVDRAWSYSFKHEDTPQTVVFESALARLMQGEPLGWALEFFNNRYAEVAADLNREIERMSWGARLESYELAALWTENNDARNYVILGDPAVRLAVDFRQRRQNTVSAPIQIHADGRPANITADDWQRTPVAVQNALANTLREIEQLTTRLKQTEEKPPVLRQSVLRDGGLSAGRKPIASPRPDEQIRTAPTRGGALRGGQIRGSVTRSFNPGAADDENSH
ncbi:MAG: C25 family cysteine peptidase [Caldilineaceae bacterium]